MSPQDHRTTVGLILRSQFKLHVSIDEGSTLTNLEVNVSVPCSASWIFPITLSKTALRLENINRNCLKVIFALMLFCVLYLILVLKRVNTMNILYIYSYYQAPHFINTKAPKFQLILSQWTLFIKLKMNTFLRKSFIQMFTGQRCHKKKMYLT